MIVKCKGYLLPFFVALLLFNTCALFSQNTQTADSLSAELKKFDAKKREMGAGAPKMMDTVKVKLLSKIALEFYINNPEKALKYANEQLQISEDTGYKWGIANALAIQGTVYDYKGDYDRALKVYMKAGRLYHKMGRKLEVLDINNCIGIVYAKKGIYTEGLKYMLLALNTAKKENDYKGIISTYNNIGLIYKGQKMDDEALKYYLECLKLQLKDKEQYAISYTYLNIGEIYRAKKQFTRALSYFNAGLKSALKEGDTISVANNYSNIGNVYIDTKDYSKALENHRVALNIRQKTEDSYGLFGTYISVGDIYLKTGDTHKALEYTQKAANLIKGRGELHMIAEAYRQLSDVYAAQGNYKLAYTNQQLYKQYNDSVFNADNQRKLTEQQMNFDFKARQDKKDLLARQALQYQKNIRNLTVAGLALIALFIIIALIKRHKKSIAHKQKKYNEGITILQEELTVAALEAQALKVEKENIELKNELIAIEKEYEKGEKEKLQEKLDFNRRELASATLYLYQKNEILSGLKADIDAIPVRSMATGQLNKIKAAIQENLYLDADWEKFRLHFEQVHPDFFKDLYEKHPDLTAYEIRLYAYLHLKLSTKEIAGLLSITPGSVRKAKMRLNKKLNPEDYIQEEDS